MKKKKKMAVSNKIREKINWFIYAYETFDENEIASNLPEVSLRDIQEVINEDFVKSSRQKGS